MKKKISIITFNCGKAFPFGDIVSVDRIISKLIPATDEPQDLYAFGFQELTVIWESTFPEIIESYVKILEERILRQLTQRFENFEYKLAGFCNVGAIVLLVFSKTTLRVEHVSQTNCKRGYLRSSLKGGASLYIVTEDINGIKEGFAFINCHFCANEGKSNMQARIDDYNCIMEDCEYNFKSLGFKDHHIFFLGDLNFRVNTSKLLVPDYSNMHVLKDILENNEELTTLRKQKKIFINFDEAPITYFPTYKYNIFDTRNFNKKRTPSWCDRILFKHYKDEQVKIISYTSLTRTEELTFTDHQPVSLVIEVPVSQVNNNLIFETDIRRLSNMSNLIGASLDTGIGYGGWLLSKNVHLYLLIVTIIYLVKYWYTT